MKLHSLKKNQSPYFSGPRKLEPNLEMAEPLDKILFNDLPAPAPRLIIPPEYPRIWMNTDRSAARTRRWSGLREMMSSSIIVLLPAFRSLPNDMRSMKSTGCALNSKKNPNCLSRSLVCAAFSYHFNSPIVRASGRLFAVIRKLL